MADALCPVRVEDWRVRGEDDWRSHERGESIPDWTPSSRRAVREALVEVVEENEYKPKTELGRRLMMIRKKIVDSGAPLLSWEEIQKELSRRRGE